MRERERGDREGKGGNWIKSTWEGARGYPTVVNLSLKN